MTRGPQTKGDKIRSGCLTPAFLGAQKRAKMLVRGAWGGCLRGVCPAPYFSINYPDFSPKFTLSWISPRVDHVAPHTFATKHVA